MTEPEGSFSLAADFRQKVVKRIVQSLRKDAVLPTPQFLKRISTTAKEIEEKLFRTATSKYDYAKKVSQEIGLSAQTQTTGSSHPLASNETNALIENANTADPYDICYRKLQDMKRLYKQRLWDLHKQITTLWGGVKLPKEIMSLENLQKKIEDMLEVLVLKRSQIKPVHKDMIHLYPGEIMSLLSTRKKPTSADQKLVEAANETRALIENANESDQYDICCQKLEDMKRLYKQSLSNLLEHYIDVQKKMKSSDQDLNMIEDILSMLILKKSDLTTVHKKNIDLYPKEIKRFIDSAEQKLVANKGTSRDYSMEPPEDQNLTPMYRESNSIYGIGGVSTRASTVGLAGLKNLGTTCFMNSAIQCLVHTQEFAKYFETYYHEKINCANPNDQGQLALKFGELLHKLLEPGQKSVDPQNLKNVPHFQEWLRGHKHHDSQEFLGCLLNGLHADLACVNGRSIIVDVCEGQYKSTVVCPVCKTKSETSEPFTCLSLPLQSTRSMTVTVSTCDGSALPCVCNVTVREKGLVGDLIYAVCEHSSLKENEELKLAKIKNYSFDKFLEDPLTSLSSIKDDDILVAYKIPMLKKKVFIKLMHLHYKQETCRWELFRAPLLSSISCDNAISHGDIQTAVRTMLLPFLKNPSTSPLVADACHGSTSGEADNGPESEPEKSTSNTITLANPHLLLLDEHDVWIDLLEGEEPIKLPSTSSWIQLCACWSVEQLELYDFSSLDCLPEVFNHGSPGERALTEQLSLYTCLENFLCGETLGSGAEWFCPNCRVMQNATRKFDFCRLPEVLLIHLMRFSSTSMEQKKLETLVDFPIHNFELTKYVAKQNISPQVYELYALINHYGEVEMGHNNANIKVGQLQGEAWYTFDDMEVSSTNTEAINSSAAYVLFYRRQRDAVHSNVEEAHTEIQG